MCFVVSSFLFAHAVSAQATPSALANKRETKRPVHYEIALSDPKRRQKEGEIRGYIWERWIKQEPASLLVTSYSKEGLRGDVQYVLEVDRRGVWSLRVEISRPDLKGTKYEHSDYWVYGIDRIEASPSVSPNKTPLPNNTTLATTQYRLVFRDHNGTQVGRGSL
jgi:hypothetical protein